MVHFKWPLTFCGFAKAGHFSTTVRLKNRTPIIRKNCQSKHCTPAFAKPLLPVVVLFSRVGLLSCLHCLRVAPCGCLVALLHFFVWLCVSEKCKCATKCVGLNRDNFLSLLVNYYFVFVKLCY